MWLTLSNFIITSIGGTYPPHYKIDLSVDVVKMVRWLSLFLLANDVILTTGEIFCRKVGFHLHGGNIKNIPFTTVQACKEECAKTEGCVAFTTAAGNNNGCWLKNKDHPVESASAIAISARMSCYEGKRNE